MPLGQLSNLQALVGPVVKLTIQQLFNIMNKIIDHGLVDVPLTVVENAETIRFENYKTNTPAKFQIRDETDAVLLSNVAGLLKSPINVLDFVYFSVCKGAEPHVDLLDPEVFEPRTYVIPIVLPSGKSVITAEDESVEVELNHMYEFNHEKIHSMTLEDNESGCVVIMIAVKK
jgi:hypothetical protein